MWNAVNKRKAEETLAGQLGGRDKDFSGLSGDDANATPLNASVGETTTKDADSAGKCSNLGT